MSLGNEEFRELIEAGTLQEQRSTEVAGERQRHLAGTIDGVPVRVALYETSLMVRVEIGAAFSEALGAQLEMVSKGVVPPAGASRDEGSFDRTFTVLGSRDGTPVRECLSPETKRGAVRILEAHSGELSAKEGGVLWARTFGGERVELGGHGADIVRDVADLAKRVWSEARTSDPAKQGRPAPTLTGAPVTPRGAMVGGLLTLIAAAICIPLTVMTYHADLRIWIFIGAIAALGLPIGGFLLGFGIWRLVKLRRAGAA